MAGAPAAGPKRIHSSSGSSSSSNVSARIASARSFSGPVELVTFGANEYEWHPNGAKGYAAPDGPPVRSKMSTDAETPYALPKASITVIRGRLGGA